MVHTHEGLSVSPALSCRHRLKSMVHSVARVTSDTGELAVGILPYFMDGILPLLKVIVGDIECDRVAGMEEGSSWEENVVHVWGRRSWSMVVSWVGS